MRTDLDILLCLSALMLLATACGGHANHNPYEPPDATTDDAALDADAESAMPAPLEGFNECTGSRYEESELPEGFRHSLSKFIAAAAGPQHAAQDVMVPPAMIADLAGKFAYGRFGKDLEDEDIDVYIDGCHLGWSHVATARTNSDGRTSTAFEAAKLALGVGHYTVRQRVRGDGSHAVSSLRLLPEGTRLVVLDIDGTLTVSDSEVFKDAIDDMFLPIYEGDYVPEAWPGAQALTWALRERGYELVYLTGRPYWLTRITREWLESQGFAPGHLQVTDTETETLPTELGVGAFKRDYLLQLKSLGYVIDAAYGNATTDIYAYRQAGLDPKRTFIIGEYGGQEGTQGVLDGYLDHVSSLASWPAITQPF